jgi:hypothetical protein
MADIKVLKVNLDGHYQEHDEAVDSIKVVSLKTANNELTDTKLTDLIGGGDASSQHDHASLYFGKPEFIDASTGVADASLPIKTDAAGKIDTSFLPSLAHDDLDGVANSTAHLAFPLLVGGRDFTAVQKYDAVKTFTLAEQLVDKNYVDNLVAAAASGDNWLQSIDGAESDSANVVAPVSGTRILVMGTGLNDFATHDNSIATYNGATWDFQEFAAVPSGSTVRVIGIDTFYLKNASNWSVHEMESTTVEANGPLFFSATNELDLALAAASGLKIVGAALAVEPSEIIDGTTLVDVADKIEINFSTAFNDMKALAAQDLNASITPFSSVNFTAIKVDTALEELYVKIEDGAFPKYTAAEAITKGDVVYISANGAVSKYASLSANDDVAGIALSSVAISAQVAVALMDFVITGVLTGAVAGARYFWDGSALSTSMSTISGENVYHIGVAKNATDLLVKVRHVRKNA